MSFKQDLGPRVRSWLHERLTERPDPYPILEEVLSQLPTTPQRRHRWWPFGRGAAPVPGNGPTPARGFSMFSTVKFVAAGVIVALFGGFLLAGVLKTPQESEVLPGGVTESPSPMTAEELLSGMVTEEVEPGVLRVVDDGVRNLVSVDAVDIGAAYDGGIWLLRENEFLRLGSDESHEWPADVAPEDHIFEVAPDGTMWVIPDAAFMDHLSAQSVDTYRGEGRHSTDGEEWTVQPCPGTCSGVTVAPDGTVWASWMDDKRLRWRVGHLGASGWQPLDGYGRGFISTSKGNYFTGYDPLFVTDAGDLYGVDCYVGCTLFHYEDGDWEYFADGGVLDVGRDGTVWRGDADEDILGGLARFADGEEAEWTAADLPEISLGFGLDRQFEAAPDGSLWFSLWQSADGPDLRLGEERWGWRERTAAIDDGRLVCDGLARFDGQTLDRFLPGRCISMDVAVDGSVWILADEEQGSDLYVITPEATE